MGETTIQGGTTLYSLNKEVMKQLGNTADLSKIPEVAEWATKKVTDRGHVYYMFLCREKNDYTIFRLTGSEKDKEEFRKQLVRLAYSRGVPVNITHNKILNGYEFWIKEPETDGEVFMYALFNCNDFVIEIAR